MFIFEVLMDAEIHQTSSNESLGLSGLAKCDFVWQEPALGRQELCFPGLSGAGFVFSRWFNAVTQPAAAGVYQD